MVFSHAFFIYLICAIQETGRGQNELEEKHKTSFSEKNGKGTYPR